MTLHGTVQSPSFVRFIEQLGQETLRSFSTDDFLVLDAVRRDEPLTDRLKARLPTLVSAGAVETLGRGRGVRYLLSKRFYAALGEKGTYTRRRGLDRATMKALLEQHIREQDQQGAGLSELKQVLPGESERSVQRMLHEMREEGRIDLTGARRWARWIIPNERTLKPS